MATEFFFNGRVIKQPGAYATIVSGQRNAPLNLDYGRVLVIDTGNLGRKWGGGAGINGELATGQDAIYRFNNIEDYQFFLKGGILWKVAEALFRPDVANAALGASEILHAKAATTTAATGTFTATGGGSNGGTFRFKVRDEGIIGNGEFNETRATSVLTVTNAGATDSVVTIAKDAVTLATYTNLDSDSVVTLINGLIESFNTLGLANVVSSTSSTITYTTVANEGDTANTETPTITVTGTAAATATAFAGGVTGTDLKLGYAYTIETGIVDTAKWIMNVWTGSFTGLHSDNIAYNEVNVDVASANPNLIASSPEFDNIQNLIDWANTNSQFNRFLAPDPSSVVTGNGTVTAADIASIAGFQLATGGTEVYTSANLDLILNAVSNTLYSFILVDQFGTTGYQSALITKIISHIQNDSRYERFLWIGGGQNEDEFDSANGSLEIAQFFDSDFIQVVHGEVGTASQAIGTGFRFWSSIYHTALVLGRTAGRPPQVPVTNKTLGLDMLQHSLTDRQRDRALDAGLIVSVFNQFINRIVVLQGVNTLQDNKVLFNNLAQSFQISFKRVVAQINTELVVNAEIGLLADENGVNANTLAAGMIKNFTETYLESRLAVPDFDNLILDYRDVVVTKQADAWLVNYALVINSEINKIFFTGFLFS